MTESISQNKLLVQFMFLSVLGGMGMGIAQIAITLYAVQLGATSSQIGLIGGAQGIGLLLTVLPIGFLVDHVGPRKVFIFGAVATALLYLLFPFANSSQTLCYFVAIVGFFSAFRFIPMSSVFLEFVKTIGSDKAGWQRGSHSFGMVFLGPLSGAFMSKYWGFNATFYAVSVSVLLLIVGALAIFPNAKASGASTLVERWRHVKELFHDHNILEASSAEALALATFSCFNAFIIVLAIRVFHISAQVASLFVSLEGLVFIATLFTLWRLLDRLGERRFYLTSIAFVVTGLIFLSSLWHPLFLVIGTVFVGIGLGMFNLVNVTRIAYANVDKGRTAGMFAMFTIAGSIIGPVVGGFAGELFGARSVFLIFIPLYLALSVRLYLRHNAPAAVVDDALLVQPFNKEYSNEH
ncbi:MAG: MFS transporter [Chlorobium sp.]|nr:MAG: MFS transporter [Chlorobium sp.]